LRVLLTASLDETILLGGKALHSIAFWKGFAEGAVHVMLPSRGFQIKLNCTSGFKTAFRWYFADVPNVRKIMGCVLLKWKLIKLNEKLLVLLVAPRVCRIRRLHGEVKIRKKEINTGIRLDGD
jgi:hypothetical protein